MELEAAFIKLFGVPEEGLAMAQAMVNEEEQAFALHMGREAFFPARAQMVLGSLRDGEVSGEETAHFLAQGYRRGYLNLCDEETQQYALADFFVRLDIFSVSEPEVYQSFPPGTWEALNRLYLQRYLDGLDDAAQTPTLDEVLPMEELLKRMEADERQIYLSPCDCRALAGQVCGKPLNTCLSYRTAPGSYASRGVSRPIGKKEAMQVVKEADKAGLMHTANPYGGICNCCADCCYLFKAQRALGSAGRWPIVRYYTVLDSEKCIGCGMCVKRCPFGLFTKQGGKVAFEAGRCVGCGLCVNRCPKKALRLFTANERTVAHK